MEKKVMISAQAESMAWIKEAKRLVKNGFCICIDHQDHGLITVVKAVHERYGSVTLASWLCVEPEIRFNWMEKVA